jgi:DHA1 family tetracycline resistance protein-like MFS transporter
MRRSPLFIIFITVFIDLVGFGIVIPVLPYYIESERFHASPRLVGILFASYSAMQLVFTPILGRLSDKYGRRPILFLSIIGTSIGFLLVGAARSLWVVFAGRILDGITGGNISTAQAYVADVTTHENRAKGLGLIGAGFGLGFIFGPAIGGILSRWGVSAPFYFAAALAACNATLLYFKLPESLTPEIQARARRLRRRDVWGEFKRARLLLVALIYFLLIAAFSLMTAAFALFTAHRFGYDAQQNGYIFAFIGIIAVFVQLILVRRVVPRYGEAIFVVLGLAFLSVGFFLMPLIAPQHGGLAALLAASGLISIGNTLAQPLLTSLASKTVGADVQGGVLGTLQSSGSLARVIGPLISAALIVDAATHQIDDHSLRVTFWTAAAIAIAATLCALYFTRAYSTAPVYSDEQQTSTSAIAM